VPRDFEDEAVRAAESPAASWLGIETVVASSHDITLRMQTRAEMEDEAHIVHSAFVALLADSAMGRALAAANPDAEHQRGFDLKLNFIAPGRIGEVLRAVARVLHSGRRTAVAECRVEGEDGRLIATATASFIVCLIESHS
jgi:uncharacterized protein (TIGR00369 family)